MNTPERRPGPWRIGGVMVAAGVVGLAIVVPVLFVMGFGLFGMLMPWGRGFPFLVLAGVVVALLVSFGARLRWRARATREELSLECDLHVRYRGLSRTVVLVGGSMVFALVMFLLRARVG